MRRKMFWKVYDGVLRALGPEGGFVAEYSGFSKAVYGVLLFGLGFLWSWTI